VDSSPALQRVPRVRLRSKKAVCRHDQRKIPEPGSRPDHIADISRPTSNVRYGGKADIRQIGSAVADSACDRFKYGIPHPEQTRIRIAQL